MEDNVKELLYDIAGGILLAVAIVVVWLLLV